MAFRFRSVIARRALAGFAVAAVAVLAACGGDDSTGPSGDNYALTSVDGQTVPITETDEFGTYTLKSGQLSLKSNGTYTVRITETYKPTGEPLETTVNGENGTYVVSGSTITFTSTHDYEDGELVPSSGDVLTGTKTATSVTISVDDGFGGTITIVFSK